MIPLRGGFYIDNDIVALVEEGETHKPTNLH